VRRLPNLSRFELQCLKKLWSCGEGTVTDIRDALKDPPTYSTIKKIVERLVEKGAVVRVRKDGRAWVYRSAVPPSAIVQKEIRRFLDVVFDGAAAPLVAHPPENGEVSVADLKEIEKRMRGGEARAVRRRKVGRPEVNA
jgi:BlaI family penicillinase repressor